MEPGHRRGRSRCARGALCVVGTVQGLLVSDLRPDPTPRPFSDEACDLAQDYFTRLLEKGVIAAADQSKGRFRAFLRTDCQHFLIDHHRRQRVRARVLKPFRSTPMMPRIGTGSSRPTTRRRTGCSTAPGL